MDFLEDLASESVAILAYCAVGIALMALGFVLIKLLTPGNLRQMIWADRNRNAALLLSSNLVAVGMVAGMAIWTTETGEVWEGVASAFTYGLMSLVVMGLAFLLLDALTPGKLGELVTSPDRHPAVYVTGAMHLAVALVIVAGLS